jgi:galactofuranose transport system permease protein
MEKISLKQLFNLRYVTITATMVLFLVFYGMGSIMYNGFFSLRTFFSLFSDNAYLGISAIGMTLVIISGGIDLSVGAVAALTTMIIAYGTEILGLPVFVCFAIALSFGSLLGFFMGVMIHHFNVPPFIATLAGMFLARGLCFVISIQSITINDALFRSMAGWKIKLNFATTYINLGMVILGVAILIGVWVMKYTKFGRGVYALGGNETSAKLMGLKVGKIKIAIYTINGCCSALAGIVFALYMSSGYPRHLLGMELDAIAAVVIGGTLLTGGYGYIIGTLFGVLIQGLIQTFINFNGTLSSWWTKIFIGVLLLLFIGLQRIVVLISHKRRLHS